MKKVIIVFSGIFVALIAVYLILCATGPKDLNITRTTTISAEPEVVYAQVSNLKNWENWSPWYKKDSTMVITYGEVTSGIGASYSWAGDEDVTGTGTIEIIEAEAPVSMKTQLEFGDWEGYSYGLWNFTAVEPGVTEVSWGITSDMALPFPLRGMMVLMGMKDKMAKDFDEGLASLKEYCEENASAFNIVETTFPAKTYVGVKGLVKWEDMESFFGNSFGLIMGSGIQMAEGAYPSGLYFTWDVENQETEMAAAIPVEMAPEELLEGMETIALEEGNALVIDYFGLYDGLGDAHYAMEDYLNETGHEIRAMVIEEYITDPMTEEDPSKWHTKIIYPVQ